MIKKFSEYSINENLNGFQNGDVVEVISVMGETENLNKANSKYIGRIYVVDHSDEHSVHTLDGGTWMISDVRKLSAKEIEKRQPEIKEIHAAWETRKINKLDRNLRYLEEQLNCMYNNLDYVESTNITKEVNTLNDVRYRLTLNIEKLD